MYIIAQFEFNANKWGRIARLAVFVGEERIELSCSCERWILSPLRLPIPPLARSYYKRKSIQKTPKNQFNALVEYDKISS